MITKLNETIEINQVKTDLSSQEYVNYTKNQNGYRYLRGFSFDTLPTWTFQVEGVEIIKTVVMKYGENTVGIKYTVNNRMNRDVTMTAVPYMQFVRKGEKLSVTQKFSVTEERIESNDLVLYYQTNGAVEIYDTRYEDDLYYADDAKDGRGSVGVAAHNHEISFEVKAKEEAEFFVIYSTKPVADTVDNMITAEKKRMEDLVAQSGMKSEIGKELVKSADQYISNRESTGGKTILAGYPFFEDWEEIP